MKRFLNHPFLNHPVRSGWVGRRAIGALGLMASSMLVALWLVVWVGPVVQTADALQVVAPVASDKSDNESDDEARDESEGKNPGQQSPSDESSPSGELGTSDVLRQTTSAGVAYLLNHGQADDGSYSKSLSPAVTAMCTSALMASGVRNEHPQIQKSLRYLESLVQPDGGVYSPGSTLRNYETSVAVMCFQRANEDGKYDKTVQQAVAFLKGLQWDDGEGHPVESPFYGGQGYGSHKRPDASNTSFFLDALEAAGEDGDSDSVQKAKQFMMRCQNLSSPDNPAHWAAQVSGEDRGGFVYSSANGGESKPGETDVGGLRSYASMTYAGLKSFLYAGVAKDDVRVEAALDWISRHYDLKTNPGMGQQGLFYYYHVFAKTLHAVGEPEVVDSEGVAHNWRNDLVAQLSDVQNPDGSWTNAADRWYEGDPNLVTSYALLALSYCQPE